MKLINCILGGITFLIGVAILYINPEEMFNKFIMFGLTGIATALFLSALRQKDDRQYNSFTDSLYRVLFVIFVLLAVLTILFIAISMSMIWIDVAFYACMLLLLLLATRNIHLQRLHNSDTK